MMEMLKGIEDLVEEGKSVDIMEEMSKGWTKEDWDNYYDQIEENRSFQRQQAFAIHGPTHVGCCTNIIPRIYPKHIQEQIDREEALKKEQQSVDISRIASPSSINEAAAEAIVNLAQQTILGIQKRVTGAINSSVGLL